MKLRPNPESELTKLKRLPAEHRKEIYEWAFPRVMPGQEPPPAMTNAQIRQRIAARWGVNLPRDNQLSEFWPWQHEQSESDATKQSAAMAEVFAAATNLVQALATASAICARAQTKTKES